MSRPSIDSLPNGTDLTPSKHHSTSSTGSAAKAANGHASRPSTSTAASSNPESSTDSDLRGQLERMQLEKEALEGQYHTLLERLGEMKSRIGEKLKADAEELEQRETLISQLQSQNASLESTISTLSSELASINAENSSLSSQLKSLRQQQTEQYTSHTSLSSELSSLTKENHSLRDQIREKDDLLERGKLEKEEWERVLMDERLSAESVRGENRNLRRELDSLQASKKKADQELEEEQNRANNLESVLEDFQSAQDSSIEEMKDSYEHKIGDLAMEIAEWKKRALDAEVELSERPGGGNERVQELETEVKEKTLLLSKVRQEAVTLNEHLIQALRRLRKFSADPTSLNASGNDGGLGKGESYVDRRLVSNVILQFVSTPRGDRKRFEMLNLLAGILGWSGEEREKAGLQRATSANNTGGISPVGVSIPKKKEAADDESFSKMWVEFLLKEASQGSSSTPYSPSTSSHSHQALTPSLFSPSTYAPSNYAKSSYAPSNYTRSNYAQSSAGGSPTHTTVSLPPLPSLPSNVGNGGRASGAFRLPSLRGRKEGE